MRQYQRSRCALVNWIPNSLLHSGASPRGDSFEELCNKAPRPWWISRCVICGSGRRRKAQHSAAIETLNKLVFMVNTFSVVARQTWQLGQRPHPLIPLGALLLRPLRDLASHQEGLRSWASCPPDILHRLCLFYHFALIFVLQLWLSRVRSEIVELFVYFKCVSA